MKKLIASASMVAVGVGGIQGANAPGLSRTETTKFWSVSGSVRGFYDDNYLTLPSGQGDRDSWGFEIAPSVAANFPRDQTYFGAAYNYSARYFEDRSDDEWDQTHEVTLNLDHRFSEIHEIEFFDSFVYSQEPEIIDGNLSAPTTRRTDSDAFRNKAEIDYNRTLTERMALALGYANNWYDYKQDGPGSRSALLDRVEQTFRIDGRYMIRETVVGVAGFQFGLDSYTADEPIDILNPTTSDESDVRDNKNYAFYVGADSQFSQRLTGSFRVGVQYTDYDNVSQSSTSPFIDNFITYKFQAESFLRFGVRHFRNATDEAGVVRDAAGNTLDATLDQESTGVYAELSHKLTPRINGRLVGQFQNSEFNDGVADGETDKFFLAQVALDYMINQFLSAGVSYYFDRLDSDLPNRSFTRNRVFFGLTAKY